jgi:hypothetical protein
MLDKRMLRAGIIGLALSAGAGISLAQNAARVAANVEVGPSARWSAHDPQSKVAINYDPLDNLLGTFVLAEARGRTSVPFARLKGDGERLLESFVGQLQKAPVETLSRDEQLAFWLNLRTLALLQQTIRAFPLSRPQTAFQGPDALTAKRVMTVSGELLSIDDIDRIILANWTEPHVVYGLTLPVRGAPSLPRVAYRGDSVHRMLEAAGRDFVNRAGVIRVKGQSVELSSFFDRHRATLGDSQAMLLHIRKLAAPKLAGQLIGAATINQRFDWQLTTLFERGFDSRASLERPPEGLIGEAPGSGS